MKTVYSVKYLDWLLIVIILFKLILLTFNFLNLPETPPQIAFFIVIVLIKISLIALANVIFKNKYSHKFIQLFLIAVLILPSLLIIYRYLSVLVLYGFNRIELLNNPFLFLQLIVGVGLFVYTKRMYIKKNKDIKT